jgi:hypothetical protein
MCTRVRRIHQPGGPITLPCCFANGKLVKAKLWLSCYRIVGACGFKDIWHSRLTMRSIYTIHKHQLNGYTSHNGRGSGVQNGTANARVRKCYMLTLFRLLLCCLLAAPSSSDFLLLPAGPEVVVLALPPPPPPPPGG